MIICKSIKINKISNVSPPIITKNGERLYAVSFEGSFLTADKKEVNDAIQEAIEYLKKYQMEMAIAPDIQRAGRVI